MDELEPVVFVVDDEEAVCSSIRVLLETIGLNVRTYNNAQDFLSAYDPAQPGCLVLDVRMPGMSGLELQSKFVEEQIGIPVIIITGHGDVPIAVKAIKMGALDFIEKPFREQSLLDNVQKALNIDACNRRKDAECKKIDSMLTRLTPRERQIMDLLVAGKINKVIAHELGISQKTVDFHRANILEKMNVGSVVELLRLIQKLQPDAKTAMIPRCSV